MPAKVTLDRSALCQLYFTEGLSTRMVGSRLGVSCQTIRKYLKENGFGLRSKREAQKVAYEHGRWPHRGPGHPLWRGGRCRTKQGYIVVRYWEHSRANKLTGAIFEHILVWERTHGPVPSGYVIHHINGIRDDNRESNLACLPAGVHAKKNGEWNKILQARIRELEKRLADV